MVTSPSPVNLFRKSRSIILLYAVKTSLGLVLVAELGSPTEGVYYICWLYAIFWVVKYLPTFLRMFFGKPFPLIVAQV